MKLSIVFSIDNIKRGGKERQLFILASSLLKRGYDIKIVSLKYDMDNYIEEYQFPKNNIFLIGVDRRIMQFVEFKKQIKKLRPGLVFSYDIVTSLYCLMIYKKLGFAFINGSIRHGIRLFKFSQLFRSLLCWSSPYIVANSFAGLKANNLVPNETRFVLYNGIERKFISKLSNSEKEKLRKEFIRDYHNPQKIFITVANLVPYKDYFTVLKSLAKIKCIYPFYYIIIGEGSLRTQIQKKIEEYELINEVRLVGRVDNVSDYLKISDLMIHSSCGEGVSNAILEGMFAGLPIIATKVGGTPEILFEKSSKLFEYKNAEQLIDILSNINSLFENFTPENEDYRKHIERFNVETMVKNFENIMSICLNKS